MISSTNASFFIAKFLFKKAQNLTFFLFFNKTWLKNLTIYLRIFETTSTRSCTIYFLSALISTISTNFIFFFKVRCSTAVDSMSKIKKQNQPKQNKKSRLSYKENYQRYDYAVVDSYSNTVYH